MVDEQPFSTTLTRGFSFIGILFMLVSVLIPRMGGYRSSGIELCSYGFFVLCDGVYLIPGILLIVLGRIIRAGFTCKESWIKYCRRDGCGDYITFGSRDGWQEDFPEWIIRTSGNIHGKPVQSEDEKSKGDPFLYTGCHPRGAGLPARRYHRIWKEGIVSGGGYDKLMAIFTFSLYCNMV